jgi:Flp pilus assembly protein CpaB
MPGTQREATRVHTPNGITAPSNVIARRRSLPGGRAVVGGFLVALAVLGVFVAVKGASKHPTTRYVVVARDVAAGTTLTPSDLTTDLVDLPGGVASRAFTDPGSLVGRIAIGPMTEGELVQRSAVVEPSEAGTAYQVSLPIERSRALAGGLVAGETVDVLVTYASETIVVSRGATVIKSDTGGRGTISSGGETVLVLAVQTPDEVLAITHGSQVGKVTVVRTTGVTADDPGPDTYRPPSGDAAGAASERAGG